ncbi:ABC transporter permease subunit [Rhizobium sp. CG5]|uniref:ABC transporter permease subunit n=1 Tax=Rhizobium sp. CG5 TaxID=2726076 RepID=UPI00203486B1|nr:ABC transporter permease subunit [Rhizobium sp. CG5]MCM2475568.1 ABC transporter permease subunit [Rhizobium sp. CG5]
MLSDFWKLMVEQGWALALLRGAAVTILIGMLGMLTGFLVAAPLAVLRWRKVLIISQLIDTYTVVIRGVPGLLVIYLLFFGSLDSVRAVAGAFGYQAAAENVFPLIVGVIAIAVISCAYSIEVMRGALQAVPYGLLEAARSLALPGKVTFFRITFPLALRLALGGINNVWQMTIKDTSLISVIGLQELMRTAAIAAGITRSSLLFYGIAAAMFFCMTIISQMAFSRAEHALNRGFGGR